MVALYNGYRVPLVIMFAVPVAAIGAFGALAITGQTLNLFSLIGVVMLVGLVSKNGILLVDFATLKVEGGAPTSAHVLFHRHVSGVARAAQLARVQPSASGGIREGIQCCAWNRQAAGG